MRKNELRSKMKSSGTAYLMFLLLGAHYAYLGKWMVQFIFWFTLGGVGVWYLIDIFRVGGMIRRYNNNIQDQIDELKEEQHQKNIEKIIAAK